MTPKIPLYLVLAFQFTIQVTGIVGIVAYLSYRSGQKTVEDVARKLIDETGDRITQRSNNYLEKARQINKINLASLESEVISLDNLDQLHRYLILQHKRLPEITSILIGTEQGDFRLINRITETQILAEGMYMELSDLQLVAGISDPNDPSRLNMYSVDENGNLGDYLDTLDNVYVRDRPWYRDAIEKRKPGWSQPFQIGNSNFLSINAYDPFFNSSQEMIGVFSANITLDQLHEFLKTLSISEQGQVFILERNGLIVADSINKFSFTHSRSPIPSPDDPDKLILPDEKVEFYRISIFNNPNLITRTAAQELQEKFGNLEQINSKQQLTIKIENEKYYLGIIPYQDDYGLDLLILTIVPESQFMGEINTNLRKTFALSILALIIAIVSSIFTSKKITKTLSSLSEATYTFTEKQEEKPLPLTYIKEIATLSESFKTMMTELQATEKLRQNYTQELEQEVAKQAAIIRQNEAKLQQIAALSPACLYIYGCHPDNSFFFEYITDEGAKILELTPQEMITNVALVVAQIHPEDRQKYYEAIQHSKETLELFNHEWRVILPSGKNKWLEGISRPERRDNGDTIWYGVILDITERKQIEQELIKAKEVAESAVKLKGEFLASMSHEIRTPINGVIGMLTLLQDTQLTTEQQTQARIAQSSAESLLTLINDILDFSKIEAGKLELENIDFNLQQQLGDFVKAIAVKAQEKDLELILDLTDLERHLLLKEIQDV
jgi:PAS domain S-box-containing protein